MEKENTLIRKPMVLVYAGPNGSGKSTILGHLIPAGEYTNADDVVASTGMSNLDAARQVDLRRYKAIDELKDFTFETVLSSEYKLEILRKAKEKGYFVKCFFILTKDPALNIARVKARKISGGHDVEPDTVRRRYWKSLANISELMELCDILHVYDNTLLGNPKRIIRKHKDETTYFPNDVWSMEEIENLVDGKLNAGQ